MTDNRTPQEAGYSDWMERIPAYRPESDDMLRLTGAERHVLSILFKHYPSAVFVDDGAPTPPANPILPAASSIAGRDMALERLDRDLLIGRPEFMFSPAHRYFVIRERGIRALFQAHGLATSGSVVNAIALLRESAEQTTRAVARVRVELADEVERREQHAAGLTAALRTLEERLMDTERRFFGQILSVSAVLVAAFALIVTGAQAAMKVDAPTPIEVLFRTSAIMLPIAGAVAFLVVVAWLFSWLKPDAGYDPAIHAPQIRPPLVGDEDERPATRG
jgi:hypothetical protein